MLNFRKIKLSDKDVVERFLKNTQIPSCQYSFANLFALRDKYGTELCIEDNALFIRQTKRIHKNKMAYFFPICQNNLQTHLNQIFQTGKNQGHEIYIFCLFEKDKENFLSFTGKGILLEKNADWDEYLYESNRIFEMKDANLSKIRRGINQFWNLYGQSVSIGKIEKIDIEEIKTFQRKWYDETKLTTDKPDALSEEHKAVNEALENFEYLDLSGIYIKIDGELKAYSYGSIVGNDTFDVIAQKGAKEYRHIYKVLFHELLRTYWEKIKWTNMEEDIGLLGLRQLKNSYRPDIRLVKYTAILPDL